MDSDLLETQSANHSRTGESRIKVWLWAVTPLVLQFLSTIILALLIQFYVDGRDFNLYLRSQPVLQADGSIYGIRLSPLQSDITTCISSGVTVLRIFSTIWSAATIWRCIFILMEKGGISLEEIDRLFTWKIYRPKSSRRHVTSILVAIVLFAAIPAQLSGPIITGSITWSSSQSLIQGQKPLTKITRSGDVGQAWQWYKYTGDYGFRWRIPMAAGFADIAWKDSRDDKVALKRVLRSAGQLTVNSTLKNVTLPYFAISSVDWIKDPVKELSPHQIASVSDHSDFNPFTGQLPTTFTLIPDDWKGLPPPNRTLPSPVNISETRLLAGSTGRADNRTNIPCGVEGVFGRIPDNIGFYNKPSESRPGPGDYLIDCYIFAWVTYVAGAAECHNNCKLTSALTVQNETVLTVLPDPMTADALIMMPMVAQQMVNMNVSLPRAFNNLNEFVTQLLVRSYAASWSIITDETSSEELELDTDVQIAIPTSRANVLWWRVLLWLALNLIFTFSGLLFIVVQNFCERPLVGDPSLAALLLDTTDVLHKERRALCNFSMLVEDDKNLGHLRFLAKPGEIGHRRVELVESGSTNETREPLIH